MRIHINVECSCHVIEGELKVESRNTRGIEIFQKDGDHYVIKGDDISSVVDIDKVDSIIILKRHVDVTLERHACADILTLKVCRGSSIWLSDFDTIFPEIHAYCKGRISSASMKSYVVDKLHIYMNPDYKNSSMIDLFRCVSEINIHYCFNGVISGTYEEDCNLELPMRECRGAAIKIAIKPISSKMQRDINYVRNLTAYKILTAHPPLKSKIKKNIIGACVSCFQNRVDVIQQPCEHETLCYDCMYKMASQYGYNLTEAVFYKCNQCGRKVEDITPIRDLESS